MINYLNETSVNGGIPNTTTKITAGLYVAFSPNVTLLALLILIIILHLYELAAYIIHKFKLKIKKH